MSAPPRLSTMAHRPLRHRLPDRRRSAYRRPGCGSPGQTGRACVSRLRSGGAHARETAVEDARPLEPPAGTQPWPVWDRDTTAEQRRSTGTHWRPGPIGIAVIVAGGLAAFGLGGALVSPMSSGKPAGSAAGLTTNGPAGVAAPQPFVSDGPDA